MTTGSSPDEDPGLIERLDAGDPPRTPEEAQARAPYERLLERIHDIDDIVPAPGWEDRAVRRWSAARRKRRLGIAVGVGVAVAVAAVLLLQLRAAPSEHRLELAVQDPHGSTRRGDAAVGDVLRVRTRVDQAHLELRVYLSTGLVARCPGSTQCRHDASIMELDWTLAEPGTYQIVVLSSSSSIPAGDGTLDRDLLDARGAGASIERRPLPVAP